MAVSPGHCAIPCWPAYSVSAASYCVTVAGSARAFSPPICRAAASPASRCVASGSSCRHPR
eukprot:4267107-Prorocentrum_lima.AAC.1